MVTTLYSVEKGEPGLGWTRRCQLSLLGSGKAAQVEDKCLGTGETEVLEEADLWGWSREGMAVELLSGGLGECLRTRCLALFGDKR